MKMFFSYWAMFHTGGSTVDNAVLEIADDMLPLNDIERIRTIESVLIADHNARPYAVTAMKVRIIAFSSATGWVDDRPFGAPR